jgi:hypothetical protein
MPRFTNAEPLPPAIAPGVHSAKVLSATVGVSPAGNETLKMRLTFPGGERITSVLTFVPQSSRVVSCFCDSAELIRPDGGAKEFDLTVADVVGRYLYVVVASDPDPDTGDLVPRVTRFLTRAEALQRNPSIASVKLQPQSPRVLNAAKDEEGARFQ